MKQVSATDCDWLPLIAPLPLGPTKQERQGRRARDMAWQVNTDEPVMTSDDP